MSRAHTLISTTIIRDALELPKTTEIIGEAGNIHLLVEDPSIPEAAEDVLAIWMKEPKGGVKFLRYEPVNRPASRLEKAPQTTRERFDDAAKRVLEAEAACDTAVLERNAANDRLSAASAAYLEAEKEFDLAARELGGIYPSDLPDEAV